MSRITHFIECIQHTATRSIRRPSHIIPHLWPPLQTSQLVAVDVVFKHGLFHGVTDQ